MNYYEYIRAEHIHAEYLKDLIHRLENSPKEDELSILNFNDTTIELFNFLGTKRDLFVHLLHAIHNNTTVQTVKLNMNHFDSAATFSVEYQLCLFNSIGNLQHLQTLHLSNICNSYQFESLAECIQQTKCLQSLHLLNINLSFSLSIDDHDLLDDDQIEEDPIHAAHNEINQEHDDNSNEDRSSDIDITGFIGFIKAVTNLQHLQEFRLTMASSSDNSATTTINYALLEMINDALSKIPALENISILGPKNKWQQQREERQEEESSKVEQSFRSMVTRLPKLKMLRYICLDLGLVEDDNDNNDNDDYNSIMSPSSSSITLRNPLIVLNLYGNNIGDHGCKILAHHLLHFNKKNASSLKHLGLANNNIGRIGSTIIIESLRRNHRYCSLQSLDLRENYYIIIDDDDSDSSDNDTANDGTGGGSFVFQYNYKVYINLLHILQNYNFTLEEFTTSWTLPSAHHQHTRNDNFGTTRDNTTVTMKSTNDVKSKIDFFLQLNHGGARQELLSSNDDYDNNSDDASKSDISIIEQQQLQQQQQWINAFHQHGKNDLSRLFYYIRANPIICSCYT